jgi:hypothetical protein
MSNTKIAQHRLIDTFGGQIGTDTEGSGRDKF